MANYSGIGAPTNGCVYVCNLPFGTDENMLAEHFGTIGLLKVWLFWRIGCEFGFFPFRPRIDLGYPCKYLRLCTVPRIYVCMCQCKDGLFV